MTRKQLALILAFLVIPFFSWSAMKQGMMKGKRVSQVGMVESNACAFMMGGLAPQKRN